MNTHRFVHAVGQWGRLVVAVLMLGPGLLHASDYSGFYMAIADYNLFPASWNFWLATLIPLLQLTLGTFLLLRVWVASTMFVAGGLFCCSPWLDLWL